MYAVAMGIIVVSATAALFYFPVRGWPKSRRLLYQKRLGLASEILVSVGLIGLIIFAARAKVDDEIRLSEKQEQTLRRQVNGEMWEYAKRYCLYPETSVPPTLAMAARYDACNYWPQIINSPDAELNWWTARDHFTEMSQAPGLERDLTDRYAALATTISELIEAQNTFALNKHKRQLQEAEISWPFVVLCALLASIGISFKWVRAALDVIPFPEAEGSPRR